MSTNIALLVEYIGTNFSGFQQQLNQRTVQGELERALASFTNEEVKIISAGRTDSGVHALNQVVNFNTNSRRQLPNYVRGLNSLLPNDIVIKNAQIMPLGFNARFDALSRTYHYYLYCGPVRTAVLQHRVGYCNIVLDINLMSEACSCLLGEHDFSSFRARRCQANTPIRTMLHSGVTVQSLKLAASNNAEAMMQFLSVADSQPLLLCFKFTATSFLYHMVRNIVGALICVGNGTLTTQDFRDLLFLADRAKAPPMFMADGLYLAKIDYAVPIFGV